MVTWSYYGPLGLRLSTVPDSVRSLLVSSGQTTQVGTLHIKGPEAPPLFISTITLDCKQLTMLF